MNASFLRSILFAWVLAVLAFPILPAHTDVPIGSAAPALSFKQLLQAPAEMHGTWEELKGQAVVLEFWATWCGGCVDDIPHINDLAEKFKAQPIRFISITDETDVPVVQQFLQHHPIHGWVAFDKEETTFKTYGVEGRPKTILVDAQGIVRAVTNPPSVTPQVVEDLLAGRVLNFPEVAMGPLLGLEANAPTPLLQLLIRPAAPVDVSGTSPGFISNHNGRYDAYGQALRDMLSDVYEIPVQRVDAPEWCSKTRYDYSLITPQHDEAQRLPLLRQMLEAAFALKVHKETKDTQAFALRTAPGVQPKLRASDLGSKGGYWNPLRGQMEVIGTPVQRLAAAAQFVTGIETFDETGLTGRYDIDLKWDPKQPASIADAIREQLGLELVPSQKKLEHLLVDSIEQKKTW